jgi:hypothetical protein
VGEAKKIEVRLINKKDSDAICRKIHYSGKVDPRSQLHFGVFYKGHCHGVMQFGPSIDKSKIIPLVSGTRWNGFLELNRLAFDDFLPKYSESRALAYAFRFIRKHYPHIEWIVSFADGAQCGDGTIYRASGFHLTQINKNNSMYMFPNGEVHCQLVFTIGSSGGIKKRMGMLPTETFGMFAKRVGAYKIPGFQLRYIKHLRPIDEARINHKILPYSEIDRYQARMYKGERPTRSEHEDNAI